MRILVPVFALLIGLAVALSFALRDPAVPPAPVPTASTEGDAAADPAVTPAPPRDTDDAPPPRAEAAPAPDAAYAPIAGLTVLPPAEGARSHDVTIRSADPDHGNPFMKRVDLVKYGAGYKQVTLSRYSDRVGDDERYTIAPPLLAPGGDAPWRYPLAAHYVTVNGSDPIVLADKPWTLAEHGPGVAQYELTLADGAGDPVVRIVRRFELDPQSYDLRLNQRFVNLTDGPLRVTLRQWLQG